MLVLRRKEGQWVDVTHHRSGDVVRIRVYNVRHPGQADLAFDDPAHNFTIQRPDRGHAPAPAPAPAAGPGPDGPPAVPPEEDGHQTSVTTGAGVAPQ